MDGAAEMLDSVAGIGVMEVSQNIFESGKHCAFHGLERFGSVGNTGTDGIKHNDQTTDYSVIIRDETYAK